MTTPEQPLDSGPTRPMLNFPDFPCFTCEERLVDSKDVSECLNSEVCKIDLKSNPMAPWRKNWPLSWIDQQIASIAGIKDLAVCEFKVEDRKFRAIGVTDKSGSCIAIRNRLDLLKTLGDLCQNQNDCEKVLAEFEDSDGDGTPNLLDLTPHGDDRINILAPLPSDPDGRARLLIELFGNSPDFRNESFPTQKEEAPTLQEVLLFSHQQKTKTSSPVVKGKNATGNTPKSSMFTGTSKVGVNTSAKAPVLNWKSPETKKDSESLPIWSKAWERIKSTVANLTSTLQRWVGYRGDVRNITECPTCPKGSQAMYYDPTTDAECKADPKSLLCMFLSGGGGERPDQSGYPNPTLAKLGSIPLMHQGCKICNCRSNRMSEGIIVDEATCDSTGVIIDGTTDPNNEPRACGPWRSCFQSSPAPGVADWASWCIVEAIPLANLNGGQSGDPCPLTADGIITDTERQDAMDHWFGTSGEARDAANKDIGDRDNDRVGNAVDFFPDAGPNTPASDKNKWIPNLGAPTPADKATSFQSFFSKAQLPLPDAEPIGTSSDGRPVYDNNDLGNPFKDPDLFNISGPGMTAQDFNDIVNSADPTHNTDKRNRYGTEYYGGSRLGDILKQGGSNYWNAYSDAQKNSTSWDHSRQGDFALGSTFDSQYQQNIAQLGRTATMYRKTQNALRALFYAMGGRIGADTGSKGINPRLLGLAQGGFLSGQAVLAFFTNWMNSSDGIGPSSGNANNPIGPYRSDGPSVSQARSSMTGLSWFSSLLAWVGGGSTPIPAQAPKPQAPQPELEANTGDPISGQNGRFHSTAVDLMLPGPFPFEIKRHYVPGVTKGGAGSNFLFNFEQELRFYYHGLTALWIHGDGTQSVLFYKGQDSNGAAMYEGSGGSFIQAREIVLADSNDGKYPVGGFIVRTRTQHYIFCPPLALLAHNADVVSYLNAIESETGDRIQFNRNRESGLVESILDSKRRLTSIQWDIARQVVKKIRDPYANEVDYSYSTDTVDFKKEVPFPNIHKFDFRRRTQTAHDVERLYRLRTDLVRVDFPSKLVLESGQVQSRRPSIEYRYHDLAQIRLHYPLTILGAWISEIYENGKSKPYLKMDYYWDSPKFEGAVKTQELNGVSTSFAYDVDATGAWTTRETHPLFSREMHFDPTGKLILEKESKGRGASVSEQTVTYKYSKERADTYLTAQESIQGSRSSHTQFRYDTSNPNRIAQGDLLEIASATGDYSTKTTFEREPIFGVPLKIVEETGSRQNTTLFEMAYQNKTLSEVGMMEFVRRWKIQFPTSMTFGLSNPVSHGYRQGSIEYPLARVAKKTDPGRTVATATIGIKQFVSPVTTFAWNDRGQILWTSQAGQPQNRTDYDESGNPTAMIQYTNDGRRVLELRYDDRGLPVEISSSDGSRMRNNYDSGSGQLISKTILSRNTTQTQDQELRTFYNIDGQKVGHERLEGVGQPAYRAGYTPTNLQEETQYDERGRSTTKISRDITPFGDILRTESSFSWNNLNQLTEIKSGDVVSKLLYNDLGAVTRTSVQASDKRNYFSKTYQFNPYLQLSAVLSNVDSDMNGTMDRDRYDYDEMGRLSSQIADDGSRKEYLYNALGQISEAKDYDRQNRMIGHETYEYDELSRLTSVEVDQLRIQENGDVVLGKPGKIKLNYGIDVNGRIAWTQRTEGDREFIRKNTYNSWGELIRQTEDPRDQIAVDYEYDAMSGKLLTIRTHHDGSGVTGSINPSSTTTRLNYDSSPFGQIARVEMADGTYRKYKYGSRALLSEIEDSSGRKVNFVKDSLGKIWTKRISGGDLAQEVHYKYEENGRLIESQDFNGNRTSYQYALGLPLVTEVTHPDGSKTSYTYDLKGRTTGVSNKKNGVQGAVIQAVAATYDSMDRMIRAHAVSGAETATREYFFDASGRVRRSTSGVSRRPLVEQENFFEGDYLVTSQRVGTNAPTLLRAKIQGSLVSEVLYPSGRQLQFDFDSLGRTTEVRENRQVVSQVLDFYGMNPRRVLWSNGTQPTVWSQSVDAAGRVLNMKVEVGGTVQESFSRAYNDRGEVTSSDRHGLAPSIYQYDSLSRLTSLAKGNRSLTWDYDQNNNIVKWTDSLGAASHSSEFNEANQAIKSTELGLITYDSRDHEARRERVAATAPSAFESDAFGQAKAVTVGSVTTEFATDANGRIVSQSAGGSSRQISYMGDFIATQRIGNATGEYLPIPGGILTSTAAGTHVQVTDIQGSPSALLQGGILNSRREHDPYGTPRDPSTQQPLSSNQMGLNLSFLAGVPSPGGLVGLTYRMYDPNQRRFLGLDPAGKEGNFPYAMGNPITFSDPLGLSSDKPRSGFGAEDKKYEWQESQPLKRDLFGFADFEPHVKRAMQLEEFRRGPEEWAAMSESQRRFAGWTNLIENSSYSIAGEAKIAMLFEKMNQELMSAGIEGIKNLPLINDAVDIWDTAVAVYEGDKVATGIALAGLLGGFVAKKMITASQDGAKLAQKNAALRDSSITRVDADGKATVHYNDAFSPNSKNCGNIAVADYHTHLEGNAASAAPNIRKEELRRMQRWEGSVTEHEIMNYQKAGFRANGFREIRVDSLDSARAALAARGRKGGLLVLFDKNGGGHAVTMRADGSIVGSFGGWGEAPGDWVNDFTVYGVWEYTGKMEAPSSFVLRINDMVGEWKKAFR